nr:MobC family plasmid mobilization relaxosome protein [Nostoc sp. KVJ3]
MRPLPKRLSKISLQTYWELGQIGNNLNQLVKATNTALKIGRTLPASPELKRTFRTVASVQTRHCLG